MSEKVCLGLTLTAVLLVIVLLVGCLIATDVGVKDLYRIRYGTMIVYNSDMTEVLYSTNDGCELKEVDGKLILITGKDERYEALC